LVIEHRQCGLGRTSVLHLPAAHDALSYSFLIEGTLFVALITSLPEVAVTLSALRPEALDVAIANLFGSNLLDILIAAIDDLFVLPGPQLSHVASVHAVSAFSAVMMSGIAVVGLLYRPKTRVFKTSG
jgi:cation:H+ antiporter